MLITLLLLGLISLIWLAVGIVMIVAPSFWQGWLTRYFTEPLNRFVLSEGILLIGLLLATGSAGLRGRWLWTGVGILMTIKALLLLGLTDRTRDSCLALYERMPRSVCRLAGVAFVTLATLLAIDATGGLH